jgi:hypothetical protein
MPPSLSLEGLKYKSFNLTIQKMEEQYVPAIAPTRFVIPEPTAKNLCPVREAPGFSEILPGTCPDFVEGLRRYCLPGFVLFVKA